MTQDQDIERVLDRWFSEGPIQMPSRFLDDTLDRIDLAPPRRLVGLRSRWPTMLPYLRFAAAAMVVVAVAGLGGAVLTRTGGIGGWFGDGASVLPTSLQSEWRPVGTRDLPERQGPMPFNLDIVITPTQLTIFDFHLDVINAAELVGPDRIQIRSLNKGYYWHCQIGDEGTYAFRISGDRQLTLTPVADACSERATVLSGDWTRTDVGNLVLGRRVSAFFRPFGGGTSGQVAYTLAAGWSLATEDDERETRLRISKASTADIPTTISVLSTIALAGQLPGCADAGPAPGATSLQTAQWLASIRDLAVTTPVAVAIGGLSGFMVDLSVRPGWTTQCRELRMMFGNDATGDYVYNIAGERRARYYLLDAGQGSILLIDVEAPDTATWDANLADATQIVASFEFTQ